MTQVLEAMGVRLKPQFVVDGINLTRDIHAENDDHILDNAWFLAAIATLQTRSVKAKKVEAVNRLQFGEWHQFLKFKIEADAVEATSKSTAFKSLIKTSVWTCANLGSGVRLYASVSLTFD